MQNFFFFVFLVFVWKRKKFEAKKNWFFVNQTAENKRKTCTCIFFSPSLLVGWKAFSEQKYVRIFLLQKRRKQNFVSFHLFFLFCNSFAFSLFTRLPSTTTPPPTLSFLTRFQKKKTGICSNLNVLFCHPSITNKKKNKTKLRNIVSPKKHDTRHTTHRRRRGLPAHLLIWGVLRVLLRHRFQCLIQHLKWSHLLFMFCIHGSKLGFIKWSSSIFNSILVICFFQNMIDQFQNICGIWPNWFWNCFCCLTCQLTQHLTVFLSWKVVCLFWHKLCFCDLGTIFNCFWWWWLRWENICCCLFIVLLTKSFWYNWSCYWCHKIKSSFFGSRFNIWTYFIWSVVFQSCIFYLAFLPRTVDFWWRRTVNFILIICVSIIFCYVQFFFDWNNKKNFWFECVVGVELFLLSLKFWTAQSAK